jgi:16S rRNA (adenine1518-N6/adenine1519-N6)-dimethyltransferase
VNHDSPAEIRATLERLGLRSQKRWGQNFLINPHARRRIVDLLEAGASDTVWEIGPGLGALTVELLRQAGRVVAFELDWGLIRRSSSGGDSPIGSWGTCRILPPRR